MKLIFPMVLWFAVATGLPAASLSYLEQIPVDTFAKMREVERFQLKVAEKFYLKGEYKAAASEYEKFITLYERSAAAPYAQLMWSHCIVKQRRVYTAIKDGFRSVIDYWPESHEATLAAYLIGQSYKAAGEINNAEKAYRRAVVTHPKHHTSVLAKWDLADIYRIRKDTPRRVQIWEDLTYKTKRDKQNSYYTTQASINLGQHHFYLGNFAEGIKAFETTYKDDTLIRQMYRYASSPISQLTGSTEKAKTGTKFADEFISYINRKMPRDLTLDSNKARARDFYYTIAAIHSHARRDQEGLTVYTQLGKLIGVNDDLRGKQAAWHRARKRYGEARKIYVQYKDREAGLSATASTWIDEKKWDNAISTYNQLIGMDKEKESQWQQSIVSVWRKAKQWDKAIATYQTLLTVEAGRFSDWYEGIGYCYEKTGKLKEAIQSYQQSDKYPEMYFKMASCHRHPRLKQYKEALVLYHQARADKDVAARATIHIGYTYEQYGQRENAIKWFQQTCKLYPKTSHASQAHAHLQSKYKISVTLGGSSEKE